MSEFWAGGRLALQVRGNRFSSVSLNFPIHARVNNTVSGWLLWLGGWAPAVKMRTIHSQKVMTPVSSPYCPLHNDLFIFHISYIF